jgi:broad specificity phosphatase PhoE
VTLRRAFAGLAFVLLLAAPAALHAQEPSVVVYLVRHAERAEDGTNDPPISAEGEARSRLVAEMMRGAGLTHIHTTDFNRTRSTVAPTAEATGLTPTVYDPRDLAAFAARLRATPGRHLVVGHSNTNTELVTALGGDGGPAISEMEYDRAYAVVVMPSGAIGSAVFRFGSTAGR